MDMTWYTTKIATPLGAVTASSDGEALTGLWFTGPKYFPEKAGEWTDKPDHPVFRALSAWLSDYFGGKRPKNALRLDPQGTAFQRSVWKQLLTIPYGQVSSYGKIAEQMTGQGAAASARAVGGAIAHNPISLLIPCHRVIGADGSLSGYAGGIDKKQALLRLENPKG
jgi:methylated-DNA-[protein]-cysteine S-methyltransferase